MLPFLKNKQNDAGIAGTIIKNRNPDSESQNDSDESDSFSAEDCAQNLMDAIKAGDAAGVAKAVKELANIADEEPHKEGKHIEPHSYDASKVDND